MSSIQDLLTRGVDELLARPEGPLSFRFLVMPTVVTVLGIRAGWRDARAGRPTFLWTILTSRFDRGGLLRSALRDVGRIMIVALVLDTTYQIIELKAFHPGQAIIVALACAILPYVLVRGPSNLIARMVFRTRAGSDGEEGQEPKPGVGHSGRGHGP